MLTDDLKTIKMLADEAFADVEDMDFPEDVKASLLENLDDITTLIEGSLKILPEQ